MPNKQLVGSGRAFLLVLRCVINMNKTEAILTGSDLFLPVLDAATTPKEYDSDWMPIPDEVRRWRFPKPKILPAKVCSTITFSTLSRSMV